MIKTTTIVVVMILTTKPWKPTSRMTIKEANRSQSLIPATRW